MHNYSSVKINYGKKVSQTVDSPIMVFGMIELSDVFVGVGVILMFGIIMNQWILMVLGLVFSFGLSPVLKSKFPKGIYLHALYKNARLDLPGIINPKTQLKRLYP